MEKLFDVEELHKTYRKRKIKKVLLTLAAVSLLIVVSNKYVPRFSNTRSSLITPTQTSAEPVSVLGENNTRVSGSTYNPGLSKDEALAKQQAAQAQQQLDAANQNLKNVYQNIGNTDSYTPTTDYSSTTSNNTYSPPGVTNTPKPVCTPNPQLAGLSASIVQAQGQISAFNDKLNTPGDMYGYNASGYANYRAQEGQRLQSQLSQLQSQYNQLKAQSNC